MKIAENMISEAEEKSWWTIFVGFYILDIQGQSQLIVPSGSTAPVK
jgi:hypothetical protein